VTAQKHEDKVDVSKQLPKDGLPRKDQVKEE